MGYRPSLRETSRKTLRGLEGSGGGSSRVRRLSSPIWKEMGEVSCVAAPAEENLRRLNTDFYLHVGVDKLKRRSVQREWLVF